MNTFLKLFKINFILIFIGCSINIKAFELSATHIINNTSKYILKGDELIFIDKSGKLNFKDVAKSLADFKIHNEKSTKEIFKSDISAKDQVIWKLSIIENKSNYDFSLRLTINDDGSNIYVFDSLNNPIKFDPKTSNNFNSLFLSYWTQDYSNTSSRYKSIIIPTGKSIKILRKVDEDPFGNESKIQFSNNQADLESGRFSVYIQGIGLGCLLIFTSLAIFSTFINPEESNKFFLFWLIASMLRVLIMEIEGDRLSEFFINLSSNDKLDEYLKINIENFFTPIIHIAFILLAGSLIDIKRNFHKWHKLFITLISASLISVTICFVSVVALLKTNQELLDSIYSLFINFYFIITYLIIGIGIFYATILMMLKKQPQAKYIFICEILMLCSWFSQYLVFEIFNGYIFPSEYFINAEFQKYLDLTFLIGQALVLNFSVISKIKFLQNEVMAITNKNREILAEQNNILEIKVKERTHELRLESQKSERLMLNILPQSIASRLKAGDEGISDSYQNATILFSDLVGFTKMSSGKTAEELVFLLNDLFKRFDIRATSLGLEKIKTIGDAYMVAGGLPTQDDTHAIQVTKMALGMYEDLEDFNKEHGMELDMRIGINSGPVVAGVIGHSKFSYDIWGNTVNTASRMESTCSPGKVQVSPSTYEQIKGHFDIKENQVIECKGLGQIMTYFVK